MILPHIQDLVAVCAGHGIRHAILSPGSRCAPISLAFNAHPDIATKVIPDERSAAFIALGMAQQVQMPVVLVCTSGSASLNYAPAIAEAYYQEIPLIVLTADRPPEWVNQYDGQTIQQHNIYGQHAKSYFELPTSPQHTDELWHCNRMFNEAILMAQAGPAGPVHMNIPLREPFYPEANEAYNFSDTRIISPSPTTSTLSEALKSSLKSAWEQAQNIWVVVGQLNSDPALTNVLNHLGSKATIINEVTGNQQAVDDVIQNQDLLFQKDNWHKISTPDLLITLGNSLISKNLKLFLRANHPEAHWHIKETDRLNDITQGLTRAIKAAPSEALAIFSEAKTDAINELPVLNTAIENAKNKFLADVAFGELKACEQILSHCPSEFNIHLANSMTVRYANFIGIKSASQNINCNRGTSGIDGSNSTAVGAAIGSDKPTLLITGDLAFFYDRNAFWNNEQFNKLRIVVLNNNGGGIFNMIEGPRQQVDHEKIFLTPHGLTAKSLANEFNFAYYGCHNASELTEAITNFYTESDQPKIIEVFSQKSENTEILNKFKSIGLIN